MMVRHIRLDRRQFYLFEGLGINDQFSTEGNDRIINRVEIDDD
jgi:hypothetical protein